MTTLPTFTNHVFVMDSPKAVSEFGPGMSLVSVDLFVRLAPLVKSWSESGKEQYELVAGGNVVLNALQLQKFAGGERVSLTVELQGHEAHAKNAVDGPRYEVSLDIMCISGPKWTAPVTGRAREKGMECGILVARASSLPFVRGGSGKREPSCFVAVSTSRDKGKRKPPRGMTTVIPNTSEPVWEEYLELDLSDSVIKRDNLMLDVIDELSQNSLLKCVVPLEAVPPGPHHNFNFYSTDGDEPTLTVSIHIPLSLNQWETSDDESSDDGDDKQWIAAAVLQVNITDKAADESDGLIARFSVSERKGFPQLPHYNDFIEVDTTQQDHGRVIQKATRKLNKTMPDGLHVDAVPLESECKGALWPFGHSGMVCCELAEANHLAIGIYHMYYAPEEGNSKLLGTAVIDLDKNQDSLSSNMSLLTTLDLVDKRGECAGDVTVQVSVVTQEILKKRNEPATVSSLLGTSGECAYHQKRGEKHTTNSCVLHNYSRSGPRCQQIFSHFCSPKRSETMLRTAKEYLALLPHCTLQLPCSDTKYLLLQGNHKHPQWQL